MFRTTTRLVTPLVAFGAGVALFPREWRRGAFEDTKIAHFNEDVLVKLQRSEEYQRLAQDPQFSQHHASSAFPKQHLDNYVGLGLLFGPDLFEIDPVVFQNQKEGTLTAFYHLGKKLISQDGQVHNGVIATILDEGLCTCGFPKLPSKKGVTAKLSIDFENQAPPDSTVVLRAKIKEHKGRKVVIEGYVETFPLNGDKPVRIAQSECVLVEPKWFRYFRFLQVF